jgi:hypothetical protein
MGGEELSCSFQDEISMDRITYFFSAFTNAPWTAARDTYMTVSPTIGIKAYCMSLSVTGNGAGVIQFHMHFRPVTAWL